VCGIIQWRLEDISLIVVHHFDAFVIVHLQVNQIGVLVHLGLQLPYLLFEFFPHFLLLKQLLGILRTLFMVERCGYCAANGKVLNS